MGFLNSRLEIVPVGLHFLQCACPKFAILGVPFLILHHGFIVHTVYLLYEITLG